MAVVRMSFNSRSKMSSANFAGAWNEKGSGNGSLEQVPVEEGLGNREVPQTGVGGLCLGWKEWENRGFPRCPCPAAKPGKYGSIELTTSRGTGESRK